MIKFKYIKNFIILFIATLFITFLCSFEENQKVYDNANLLTEQQIETLQQSCITLANQKKLDIVIVTESNVGNKTSKEFANDFYINNGFGYNEPNGDGVILLIDMQNRVARISYFGDTFKYFSENIINQMIEQITSYLKIGDYYGGCNSFLNNVNTYVLDNIERTTTVIEENQKVYDNSNLLTEQQINDLQQKCLSLSNQYKLDIVIVTESNVGDKTSKEFANDFYISNGFGYNEPNGDGVILLIDMQNRIVRISYFGNTSQYFSENIIDQMIEQITNYLKAGDYYGGCNAFLDNLDIHISNALNLSDTEQTSANQSDIEQNQKVYDNAKLLTEQQIDSLQQDCLTISNRYKLDIVIVTESNLGGKTSKEFADDFYTSNGFGYNEPNGDGIILLIDMQNRVVRISYFGNISKYFSSDVINKMIEQITYHLKSSSYYKGCNSFLENISFYIDNYNNDSTYNNNTTHNNSSTYNSPEPISALDKFLQNFLIYLVFSTIIAVIGVVSLIFTSGGKMTAGNNTYLDKSSVKMNIMADNYINTTITKRIIKHDDDTGRGSSDNGGSGSFGSSDNGGSSSFGSSDNGGEGGF